jgi:hypothetical protein
LAILMGSAFSSPGNMGAAWGKVQTDASNPPPAAADKAAEPSVTLNTQKLSPETQQELQRLSQAMQEQNQAISNELKDEEELFIQDIAMLWQAAVERSGTIRYAIEKLSRRDATGKPVTGDSFTKRILQSAARVGGVASSVWSGTPTGMLGGSMVEDMLRGNPQDPSQMRITDADMLILAKEVEALQSHVIETYYEYRHARQRWKISQEATSNLLQFQERFEENPAANNNIEKMALAPVVDSLIQSARQEESAAKQAFVHSRNALGLVVGAEALLALEQAQSQPRQAHQSTP